MEKIYSIDLKIGDTPVPFVIMTMEEVERIQGPFNDAPHRHNYYSVIWSLNARGKHIIDFHEYPVGPGCIFFVSPLQVHQVITEPGSTGIVILFTPEFLHRHSINPGFISDIRLFNDSDETPPLPVTAKMEERLKFFSDEMLTAWKTGDPQKYEIIGAYLKLFLIECNSHCCLHEGKEVRRSDTGVTLVQRFKELVEKHWPEWHQVQNYADALNVTPNHLNEMIRATIRRSAKDYIQNRLVLEAKRMALFTGKSSKEIGFELGFEDPSHFSKFFKNFTGQSLQDFREANPA
jgi:AraC family transcriptional regulator, transcriptional activator of pobA